MTRLALRNPIAILMASIGVIVFAAVVTPRMSVDTFPELTPPVLVVGTLAPGLGPKDVEKTITWRVEKYVSATPGVNAHAFAAYVPLYGYISALFVHPDAFVTQLFPLPALIVVHPAGSAVGVTVEKSSLKIVLFTFGVVKV